jgi:hypothetical protein
VPNVQWKTPDDGQTNCPKLVKFFDKNKFGEISMSVGLMRKKLSPEIRLLLQIKCVPAILNVWMFISTRLLQTR